jgi:hypothetical protein
MLTALYFCARILAVLALFAVLGAAALWGQPVNETISGTVPDPSAAAIANATVEAQAALPSVHIGSDRASGRDVFGVV